MELECLTYLMAMDQDVFSAIEMVARYLAKLEAEDRIKPGSEEVWMVLG